MPLILTLEETMAEVTNKVEDVSIAFADNGYIIKYGGYDDNEEWASAKMVVLSLEEAFEVIRDVATNKR
jgi:hypothetical protein